MGRVAIISGASGLVGKQLLFKLLENRKYNKVIAVGRSTLHIEHEKLRQYETDFVRFPDIHWTEKPQIDAFCALGTTIKKAGSQAAFEKVDFEYIVSFAHWAHTVGANSFMIVSAVGANADSNVFYSRVKGKMEQSVSTLYFQRLYIFRPSFLLGNRVEFRLGERIGIGFAMLLKPLLVGKLSKYKPIHAAVLANSMVHFALYGKDGTHIVEYDTMVDAKANP